jgi:hypothetical protein
MRGPGLTLTRRQAHAVQRGGDVVVRPSRRHGADNGHGLLGGAAAVFAGFGLTNSQLRALAATPMDREDDLTRTLIVIGDDVGDERAQKLLARSHRNARRIPGCLQVLCEPREVGCWLGGVWPLQLCSAINRYGGQVVKRADRLGLVWHDGPMPRVAEILILLVCETLRWLLAVRSNRSIKAENLFLRRQLALYIERGTKPRRIDRVTRIGLTLLSRFFNWRDALVVVRPETLIRWHRAEWKLFWRLKSRSGRPAIPPELQALIRRIANENPSWGEERIANELLLKIGVRVSPRTVNKYLPRRPQGRPRDDLRWPTVLRLHAQGIIACDFFSPPSPLHFDCCMCMS